MPTPGVFARLSRASPQGPGEGTAMAVVRERVELPALVSRVQEIGRQVIAPAAGDVDRQARVMSYGEAADYILVTCRRSPDAAASDQSHVLVKKADYQLEPLSTWDTLGFRGTCSLGFVLRSSGAADQILPVPFADILSETM